MSERRGRSGSFETNWWMKVKLRLREDRLREVRCMRGRSERRELVRPEEVKPVQERLRLTWSNELKNGMKFVRKFNELSFNSSLFEKFKLHVLHFS